MYKVNNLPANFKAHKYVVAKDLLDYEGLEPCERGYWYWGCYDKLSDAQAAVDEFRGTSMYAVIMDSEDVEAI